MLENRPLGASGNAGGINFKSGDISGTAAKTADDRASQGTEYFMQGTEEMRPQENFTDRSMELRGSLAQLALLNASYIIRNQKKKAVLEDDETVEAVQNDAQEIEKEAENLEGNTAE